MAKKKTSTTTDDPILPGLAYEDALAELQTLVESIEGGEVSLERSLEAYRRGEALLAHCRALLDRADQTVRTLSLGDAERAAGVGDDSPEAADDE